MGPVLYVVPHETETKSGSLRRCFFGKYRGRALLDYFVAIAPTNDWKILNPSVQPSSGSDERSGWGIMPRTFRPALQIPAILSREPFGLASTVTGPSGVEQRNTTRLSRRNSARVASSTH